MEKHYGQIVEYVVRRAGYSITDLANAANVNRRTIYNWFQCKYLKKNIVQIIGNTLRYDFSKEFPEFFTTEDFTNSPLLKKNAIAAPNPHVDNPEIWRDKYLKILEEYNKVLLDRVYHQNQLKSEVSAKTQ